MPIISQCPVTESFPFDASAMRPIAACGDSSAYRRTDVDNAIQSKAPERRQSKRDLTRDVAKRVAAFVAVHASILEGAGAYAVEHDDDDSGKEGGHGLLCEQGFYRCQRLEALTRSLKPH